MEGNTIKSFYQFYSDDNQPQVREKLKEFGIAKLSTKELIMLILGTGIKGCNVEMLAEKVMEVLDFRNSDSLYAHLSEIKGIGKSKASQIISCLELGKRLENAEKKYIQSVQDVIPLVKHYALEKVEYFICIMLNGANEIIKISEISKGASNSALIQPREVFPKILENYGSAVIYVHNHPSGDVTPSAEDMELTERMVKAGKILGIQTLDHVIISLNSFFSFAQNNYIKRYEKELL